MTKAQEEKIRDLMVAAPNIARQAIEGQSSAFLSAWYALETREGIKSSIAKALRKMGVDPAESAPASSAKPKPKPKPKAKPASEPAGLDNPSTDAAFDKVREVAAESGDPALVAATERTEAAVRAERPKPKPKAKAPAPVKPAAKPKPTPKAAKPAPKPAPEPVRVARSERFTPEEISAAVTKFGDPCTCTKCGKSFPLMEGFGLRRMNPTTIRRQAQCRECRNKAARKAAGVPVRGGPKRK